MTTSHLAPLRYRKKSIRSTPCRHKSLAWDVTFCKAFCTDCGSRFVERLLVDETTREQPTASPYDLNGLKEYPGE